MIGSFATILLVPIYSFASVGSEVAGCPATKQNFFALAVKFSFRKLWLLLKANILLAHTLGCIYPMPAGGSGLMIDLVRMELLTLLVGESGLGLGSKILNRVE